jgi:hypothetical protein
MRRRVATLGLLVAAGLAAPALAGAQSATPTWSVAPAATGWWTAPVTISWQVNGTVSPKSGDECNPTTIDRDTVGRRVSCTVTMGPASSTGEITVRLDRTPPVGVSAAAARPPDNAGWYTAPVGLTWTGSDPTSGIASCTTMAYSGPDSASAAPVGQCVDRAGNSSAPVAFPLSFDVTPPGLSGVSARVAGTTATLRWTPAADVASTSITRQDGAAVAVAAGAAAGAADGPLTPGAAYTWTVTVRDAAGNATSATASATAPTRAALAAKAAAAARPTLAWKARPSAKYYNLQLFRAGRKVLTAWPTRSRYRLPRTWRLNGRTRRLVAGTYRWYVWPGYGPRARHRYGRLLAQGKVTISAAAVRAAYR